MISLDWELYFMRETDRAIEVLERRPNPRGIKTAKRIYQNARGGARQNGVNTEMEDLRIEEKLKSYK